MLSLKDVVTHILELMVCALTPKCEAGEPPLCLYTHPYECVETASASSSSLCSARLPDYQVIEGADNGSPRVYRPNIVIAAYCGLILLPRHCERHNPQSYPTERKLKA